MEHWSKPSSPSNASKSGERLKPRKSRNYIAALAQKNQEESDPDSEVDSDPEPVQSSRREMESPKLVELHHDDFVSNISLAKSVLIQRANSM